MTLSIDTSLLYDKTLVFGEHNALGSYIILLVESLLIYILIVNPTSFNLKEKIDYDQRFIKTAKPGIFPARETSLDFYQKAIKKCPHYINKWRQ